MRGYGKRLRLLDPFAGSGTSLVAAARLGHSATGLEVNPFLAFAAGAKCHVGAWAEKGFNRTLERLCSKGRLEIRSPLEGLSTFTQREGASRWLFNRSVARGFSAINSRLDRRIGPYAPLKLALLAAAMECCNATPDGKCLRYRQNWESLGYSSEDLRSSFQRRARIIFDDLNAQPLSRNAVKVRHGDARSLIRRLRSESHDLLVTSPPYLNSFDYTDVYRPEMFLGGFVQNNQELYQVRLRTIRSHVQANWRKPRDIVSPMLVPLLERLVGSERLWDHRIPSMVQAYFEDMQIILREGHRVTRKGGQAWIVVSTSAYDGVEIPVDLIIADIATRQRWSLTSVNVLRGLRASGQHWRHLSPGAKPPLRESLIILHK